MAFIFKKTKIPEVILIQANIYEDERGFFMETYKSSEFKKNGIKEDFIQYNHSYSKKDVLRGLHYQSEPFAQGKLVRCLRGEIFDVAVDIRRESTTFGKWIGVILSDKNRNQLYIPPGFAHGFCVISNDAEVVYKCTKEFSAENEGGIIWNDRTLNVSWPTSSPILSVKDAKHPKLRKK